MKLTIQNIVKRAESADWVVIVGAGDRGRKLLKQLRENAISVIAFFDNDEVKINDSIQNVKIMRPYKMQGKAFYVVASDNVFYREELISQLLSLNIDDADIAIYDYYGNYDYWNSLTEKDYIKELEIRYYKVFGREINWKNPTTYNEKMNCEKLRAFDEFRTRLVDKFLVRDWVREQIGSEYLTRLYAVWDDANEINFDDLPERFVLKTNNGSGRNLIVKDKAKLNQDLAKKQLNEWKVHNYAFTSFELQYKNIVPKIICEEYLEGVAENVYEYDIYCFHGEPEYIWCIKGSHKPDCKASFYNKNWEMQPFSHGYPKDEEKAPRPEKLDEMLRLSRILSREFKHVRVDWYNLPDGRVLFGEMTLTAWSGLKRFEPDEYDAFFGSLI